MARIDHELLNYSSLYEKDGVLTNKLGIDNTEDLEKVERMITGYKLAKLYLDPGEQTFDVSHYLSIHKFLFDDIYPFAGEIRSEVIQKRITFCPPLNIYNELRSTLEKSRRKIPYIDDSEKLLRFVTELYSDLDVIHPFREGNGRTAREFMRQYVTYICEKNDLDSYFFDYSKIEDRSSYIEALVRADAYLDYEPLQAMFSSIMEVKENKKTGKTR